MSELTPEAQRLLAQLRDLDDPTPQERASGDAAVRGMLAAHGVSGVPALPAREAAVSLSPAARSGAYVWRLGGVLAVALGVYTFQGLRSHELATTPPPASTQAAEPRDAAPAMLEQPLTAAASGHAPRADSPPHATSEASTQSAHSDRPDAPRRNNTPARTQAATTSDALTMTEHARRATLARNAHARTQAGTTGDESTRTEHARDAHPRTASAAAGGAVPPRSAHARREGEAADGATLARSAAPAAAGGEVGDADSSLRDELKFLASVDADVRAGAFERALRRLDQHRGTAALAEERAALRVLALCGRDDDQRAARARDQFLKGSPSSVLAARVRGACPAEPAP